MEKIVCFHLFNDYSGSPKVLKTIIEGLLNNGHCIDLVTSRGGVLDELQDSKGLKFRQYQYKYLSIHTTSLMVSASSELMLPFSIVM